MRSSVLTVLATAASLASAAPRYVMYFDQWHTTTPPPKDVTAGVNYVITAFAPSTSFNWAGWYAPFMPLDQVRALFDKGTKVCMAVGGWGDTEGFSAGAASAETRKAYAKNIADTLDRLGYDCVDIDWEYPGGNGEDYRRIPNSQKVSEIETYPLLLAEIKAAIGKKELSIAVPGREGDMIAYGAKQIPKIDKIVDFINVMTYDLMNRRDNVTDHHTGIEGSKKTIDIYLERGMTASKMNLGFAFYAKWFTTKDGAQCKEPTGCPVALLEAPDGSDTGLSGAITFEKENFAAGGAFPEALKNGKTDSTLGGAWYWDAAEKVYWTWDTPELIARKFKEIVVEKKLGGAMAWSLAQDSYDWSHFKAMRAGVQALGQQKDADPDSDPDSDSGSGSNQGSDAVFIEIE